MPSELGHSRGGMGLILWGIRRYVYRPLLAIRSALVHFPPRKPPPHD